MKFIIKSVVIFTTSAMLAFGLQSCNTAKPIDKADLSGHWILQTLNGEKVSEIHSGIAPTIEFNFEEGTMAGSAGCNRYTGSFAIDGNKFNQTTETAVSMMMCLDMKIESAFLSALKTKGFTLSIDDAKEQLVFSKDDKAVLVFKKGKQIINEMKDITVENLQGKWKLNVIRGGDIKDLFGDNPPTMIVTTDAKVSGFAGCNQFMTNIKISENKNISFDYPAGTKMACEKMEGEGIFLTTLEGKHTAILVGDKLSLSKDGSIALEFDKIETDEE